MKINAARSRKASRRSLIPIRKVFIILISQGRIAYPVHEITIAGNLREMLRGIVAVGADTYTSGTRTLGSLLIERMTVAGS